MSVVWKSVNKFHCGNTFIENDQIEASISLSDAENVSRLASRVPQLV